MPVNQLCLCAVEEMTCQENERENSNSVPSKIHLTKKTWGWDTGRERKISKAHWEVALLYYRCKKQDFGSGIFAVAELRTGLELVNNITEHLYSPEKDVRGLLASTGCSLQLPESCGGTWVPHHHLAKLSPTGEHTQRKLQQVLNPRRQEKNASVSVVARAALEGTWNPWEKTLTKNCESNWRRKNIT